MTCDHTLAIDPPRVHPADAATLMAHHLGLASAYFEACPEEHGPALAALARVFSGHNDLALGPARLWFDALSKVYEENGGTNDD